MYRHATCRHTCVLCTYTCTLTHRGHARLHTHVQAGSSRACMLCNGCWCCTRVYMEAHTCARSLIAMHVAHACASTGMYVVPAGSSRLTRAVSAAQLLHTHVRVGTRTCTPIHTFKHTRVSRTYMHTHSHMHMHSHTPRASRQEGAALLCERCWCCTRVCMYAHAHTHTHLTRTWIQAGRPKCGGCCTRM